MGEDAIIGLLVFANEVAVAIALPILSVLDLEPVDGSKSSEELQELLLSRVLGQGTEK